MLPLPYPLAFIPESMATINIVLVGIVDFESVCTYKSLFGSSVMLQSSSSRVRELLGTPQNRALSRVAMPWFFEGAELFTLLCPLRLKGLVLSSGLS